MPDDAPRTAVHHTSPVTLVDAPWAEPLDVLAPFADEPYAGLLLGGGSDWSYLVRQPDVTAQMDDGLLWDMAALLGPPAAPSPGAPPFCGGVIGLASYEASARLESTAPQERGDWPDLVLARYPALLAFHAPARRVVAVGRGRDSRGKARRALAWLKAAQGKASAPVGALTEAVACGDPQAHALSVRETVRRIGEGEIFQANLARPWHGRLARGATPYDLFRRLAERSPAAYAAYWRLPGRALVSNSPEQFLSVRKTDKGDWVESSPIKGTRPRGPDEASDRALARELLASPKDRAENLMIVDLVRNDLARVCAPGTVQTTELAALHSFANVHHLISTVRGRLAGGRTPWDAFLAAFPPGSVTGAPKLQAMKVIADYEPPRGPYCGSLFWTDACGSLEASVLIRTVALTENDGVWRFEARAGGGVVADSDPYGEVAETDAKISAILAALAG